MYFKDIPKENFSLKHKKIYIKKKYDLNTQSNDFNINFINYNNINNDYKLNVIKNYLANKYNISDIFNNFFDENGIYHNNILNGIYLIEFKKTKIKNKSIKLYLKEAYDYNVNYIAIDFKDYILYNYHKDSIYEDRKFSNDNIIGFVFYNEGLILIFKYSQYNIYEPLKIEFEKELNDNLIELSFDIFINSDDWQSSSNPSYFNIQLNNQKCLYFTTICIYDNENNLLAVCKLSKPLSLHNNEKYIISFIIKNNLYDK